MLLHFRHHPVLTEKDGSPRPGVAPESWNFYVEKDPEPDDDGEADKQKVGAIYCWLSDTFGIEYGIFDSAKLRWNFNVMDDESCYFRITDFAIVTQFKEKWASCLAS